MAARRGMEHRRRPPPSIPYSSVQAFATQLAEGLMRDAAAGRGEAGDLDDEDPDMDGWGDLDDDDSDDDDGDELGTKASILPPMFFVFSACVFFGQKCLCVFFFIPFSTIVLFWFVCSRDPGLAEPR